VNQVVLRTTTGQRLELRSDGPLPSPGAQVRLAWERSVPIVRE